MRFIATDVPGVARRGLVAATLLALCASSASAQMVFDGNLLFSNNGSGTLAGQFSGAAGAGAPSCAAGLTAATLGTTIYTHNSYADPLLPDAIYKTNVMPNFQPGPTSPAWGNAMTVPNDGFFEQVCYQGAIGPNPGDDWTQGWTYYDSNGAGRTDLHLTGMPEPRPLAIYNNISIYGHQFWSPDSNYLIKGQLRIKSQASLSIPPGDVVFEEFATLGTIVVERGGQIWAIGTQCDPIIITSDDAPGSMIRGHCGGIVINGYAKTNIVNSCAGDSSASEGGAIGFYGGNDDADNSGTLRYVRIEYSGKEITPNNELNSFTFNACGSNTHADYCEAFQGADDSFEWFGGDMSCKHLVGIDGTDDGYDWQLGTRNKAQFVILRISPFFAPSGTQNGDKGIEADDNEFDFNATVCSGRSFTQLANFTIIGDHRTGASFPGPTAGVNFRRGTEGTMLNSIIYNMKTAALKIDDDATWEAHCANPPAVPTVFCPGGVAVQPLSSGSVFVMRSAPNPFRSAVNFSFNLPQSGHVVLEVYSIDGRKVSTLVNEDMLAGAHNVTWNLDGTTKSGVYFYKVLAAGVESSGKVTRLN